MVSKRLKGQNAEEYAYQYLTQQQGLSCLARNYRSCDGEIDLVCFEDHKKVLVFVEVRSGNSNTIDVYQNSITERKKAKIIKVAQKFIENLEVEYDEVRFDAVFVESGTVFKAVHIKNIIFLL